MDTPAPTETRRILQDRYAVERVLGEGSSAQTLLAEDRELGRLVAIKELRVGRLTDWKHYELFEREARVQRSLRHHAVPEIYDVFSSDSATGAQENFLVQEYIEGTSLLARIVDGPRLGRIELTQLCTGLLDVLDYLHSRTPPVYHRDIKPSNIIIRPTGAPVLVDFGGVCDGWRAPGAANATLVGTPGYMPPEQVMGRVGPTADLYALGATLLHALTGRPPSELVSDAGQIAVPQDLPADPGMTRLLTALLQPDPRGRPADARAARELLVAEPDDDPASHRVVAPARSHRTPARLITVGPPPRVADRASDALYDAYNPSGTGLIIFVVLFTFGLALLLLPALLAPGKKLRRLYEGGHFTLGRVMSISGKTGSMVAYAFEVDGKEHRARAHVPKAFEAFEAGDPIGVLYMADDPAVSSTIVAPA